MNIRHSLGIAALATLGVIGTAAAQNSAIAAFNHANFTPPERPTMIDGVRVACDGVGSDERAKPEWEGYSLKLSFVGDKGQYLGNEMVNVTGNAHTIALHCEGPWALLDLPAGTYHVAADVWNAGHRSFTAHVSGTGQHRVVVRFPAAGGQVASNAPAAQG
jgi:hypothetical protein